MACYKNACTLIASFQDKLGKPVTECLFRTLRQHETMEMALVTSEVQAVQSSSQIYYIIILCFSYLATWLPFFNKPIDWLIDWNHHHHSAAR